MKKIITLAVASALMMGLSACQNIPLSMKDGGCTMARSNSVKSHRGIT